MRIAVIEPDGSGGLVQFAYQLCSGLAACGADVTLITSRSYELADLPHDFKVERRLELWSRVEARGLTRISMAQRMWRASRRAWRGVVLLREWAGLTGFLLRQRYDVVQFGVLPFPGLVFFLEMLRRRGLFLAQICHEFEDRDLPRAGAVVRRLRQRAFASLSVVFFLSEEVRKHFLELHEAAGERTFVVPHGNEDIFRRCARPVSDVRGRYGLAEGDIAILYFGVVRPSKGVEDLLDAFIRLAPPPHVKLLIIGYPTKHADMEGLRAVAAASPLARQVVFDPRYVPKEEVGAIVELANVVVLPYRSATQSGVLHLAYSFGRPVIATAMGELARAVLPGRTGFVVPPQSPDALKDALAMMLADPDRARAMGEQARQVSETCYAWPRIARLMLDVYDRALATRPRYPCAAGDPVVRERP